MTEDGPRERDTAYRLIERLVAEFPRRRAGSAEERQALDLVAAELDEAGFDTHIEPFEFCDNLYRVIALHFGLGTVGSLLGRRAPLAALALHLGAASYWQRSALRTPVVHPLLPRGRSHNLLGTLPATDAPALRLVIPAHIDGGFAGQVFSSGVINDLLAAISHGPVAKVLDQPLALATYSQLGLAALDALALMGLGRGRATRWLRRGLTIPGLVTLLLSAEVAIRDDIVPGANDDLSGVAGALMLARRLAPTKPANVEIVVAITGAEEVGLAGARALAEAGCWGRDTTVVVALDGLTNGALHFFVEGELERTALPGWIEEVLGQVIVGDPRFADVTRHHVPVGGTDAYAFRQRGYDGVCIGCVDPRLGTPKHYHQHSDVPDNLDMDQLMISVDFAEQLCRAIIARRVG
ncbi:MAG: M20/M25/M40 family metallo-hydrolase [Deltaproteobacteria bacterium]|nr:M20/M25/M40 family metallo-hydrolase [Deltaproteobacteria bacterium]